MKNYTELEQKIIDKEEEKLKRFQISYFYLATGMEGIPDIYPEKIIEAPTKEMAAFIYHTMFFTPTTIAEIEYIKSYSKDYKVDSFEDFLKMEGIYQYWGTSIKEL